MRINSMQMLAVIWQGNLNATKLDADFALVAVSRDLSRAPECE